ncbi:hypothetical protein AHAS_Ahas15G0013900 [Arachis hypogaea]
MARGLAPIFVSLKKVGRGRVLSSRFMTWRGIPQPVLLQGKTLKGASKEDDTVPSPSSLRHVLDKGFRALDFVDQYFMSEETKLVLAKIPLEDTLPRVQQMLLHSATYVCDAEIKIANLRSNFLSKDKAIIDANSQIQKLSSIVATL